MTKGFLITFAIGLAAVALATGIVFYTKQGAHLDPKGSVLKARTQELDADHSLLLLDVRLVNGSDIPMVVRTLEMSIDTASGNNVEGVLVAGADMKEIFHYYPLLGEQFNSPLVVRDKIAGRETADRMIAARFDVSLAELEKRKQVTVKVEDRNGAVAEIKGK